MEQTSIIIGQKACNSSAFAHGQEKSCHTYVPIDYNRTALTKDFKLLNIFI